MKSSSHPVFHKFQNTVLDQDDSDIMFCYPSLSKRLQVGIDTIESCLDGISTLVVHANTYQYFKIFEIIGYLLFFLCEFG